MIMISQIILRILGLNHYNFILIKRKFIINNYMIYGRLSMQGEMQDKCGVVGIHSVDDSKDVSSLIYYCLYALQHRGHGICRNGYF